jgi:hypothetical protein
MGKSRMRWAGHVAWMWEKRNAHRILVGKGKEKQTTRKTKTCGWLILKWVLER